MQYESIETMLLFFFYLNTFISCDKKKTIIRLSFQREIETP